MNIYHLDVQTSLTRREKLNIMLFHRRGCRWQPLLMLNDKGVFMSWYQTVGKAVAGTASVAGVITAAPVFGAVGTITAGGIVVSAFVGTSAALIDKAVQSTRTPHPMVTSNEYSDDQ